MSFLSLALPFGRSSPEIEVSDNLLGRITEPTAEVFTNPSFAGEKVKTLWRDDLIEIQAATVSDGFPEHNPVWYLAKELGYLHSSGVQPVKDQPNEPLAEIPYGGVLMEVTVPYVDARWLPRQNAGRAYRFYYTTTHWVTGVSQDVRTDKWYRISDDKYEYHYYAPAEAFRPVSIHELSPISPEVPLEEKRVRVDLPHQWVLCYEGSNLVFATKVSTGAKFSDGWYLTPEGEFMTFRKRPSRHMSAGNLASGYDLPGVPWVVYITEEGVSFHGTYWHNDFGAPRSHGCINMSPDAAKWFYRWTQPLVPPEEQEVWLDYGTSVIVGRF